MQADTSNLKRCAGEKPTRVGDSEVLDVSGEDAGRQEGGSFRKSVSSLQVMPGRSQKPVTHDDLDDEEHAVFCIAASSAGVRICMCSCSVGLLGDDIASAR